MKLYTNLKVILDSNFNLLNKHTQTIRRQQLTNCLSVFNHFVWLALKGLKLRRTHNPKNSNSEIYASNVSATQELEMWKSWNSFIQCCLVKPNKGIHFSQRFFFFLKLLPPLPPSPVKWTPKIWYSPHFSCVQSLQ